MHVHVFIEQLTGVFSAEKPVLFALVRLNRLCKVHTDHLITSKQFSP